MPEIPDLIYVEAQLAPRLAGARVQEVQVGDPTPLRMMVPGDPAGVLTGRHLIDVQRRGHFLRFAFEPDLVMVINAMLAGRYTLVPAVAAGSDPKPLPKSPPKSLVLSLVFDNGQQLRYLDPKRMGKVYVASQAQECDIPAYNDLGIDVVSAEFTFAQFQKLAKKRRDQVRNFLMDKTALASIGNAYADEILFDAGIHPKTFCHQLDSAQLERLFHSVVSVLAHAVDHIAKLQPNVSEKVRDFLNVRGRGGQPCVRCGTTVRSVRVGAADADFCPSCQPAQRALFIDWSNKPKTS